MKCYSGKHEWSDPTSAQRCCNPRWSRELRYGMSDLQPDDDHHGIVVVHGGGGLIKVWRRLEPNPD